MNYMSSFDILRLTSQFISFYKCYSRRNSISLRVTSVSFGVVFVCMCCMYTQLRLTVHSTFLIYLLCVCFCVKCVVDSLDGIRCSTPSYSFAFARIFPEKAICVNLQSYRLLNNIFAHTHTRTV